MRSGPAEAVGTIASRVKILFVMRHPAAVRSLDSVLRMLDSAGHHVHLAFGGIKPDAHKVLQQLADECEHLTFGDLPGRGSPGWAKDAAGWDVLARRLRNDTDYLRYLEPSYADAPALRARAKKHAHPITKRAARFAKLGGAPTVRVLRHALEHGERCLEPPPHVVRFLQDFAPDVVVVTHLARDSVQADYVRAAKRLGIHTVYPVFSWDNLTNKGLVHELPELVLVWNDLQAREAVEMHAIPRERVRVLGAWSYDHWFTWTPNRSREDFCAEVGLRADRPIVLYVCSSGFVARDEVRFVRRWLKALRSRDGLLAEAGVIVRPHPRNATQWAGVSLDDPQATVWPRLGEEPLEAASRQHYFDSIYHSAAVVGINTSAQIESAIVGRPVHTILDEAFRETQQGTLHFQYLRADDFGHLYVGRTMDEHLDQLEESLRGREGEDRNERFLRRFVRPLGLDVAATPLYVETVEELAASPRLAPDPGPPSRKLVRKALAPAAAAGARRAAARKKHSDSQPTNDLREAVRQLKRRGEHSPVVAGPWLQGELGELLYWIPFLRWAQTATYGLRDRLTVVCPAATEPWYAGIGFRHVTPEDAAAATPAGAIVLEAGLVEARRAELSRGDPEGPFQRRRLEFEGLAVPDLPSGIDLPPKLIAVSFGNGESGVTAALAEHAPFVDVSGFDRAAQAAVLGRARGFVGSYGVEAFLSVLLGRPAVVVAGTPDPNELRIASTFLARPPFGRLHVLDAGIPPAEAAEQARRLIDAPVEALAGV